MCSTEVFKIDSILILYFESASLKPPAHFSLSGRELRNIYDPVIERLIEILLLLRMTFDRGIVLVAEVIKIHSHAIMTYIDLNLSIVAR